MVGGMKIKFNLVDCIIPERIANIIRAHDLTLILVFLDQ
jgi:hypothetical protein